MTDRARLDRSDSWPEIVHVLNRRARIGRQLSLKLDGEPLGKGRRGSRAAIEVQQQLIAQMEELRRFPFTGPVAVDINAVAGQRNPPGIHRLAKYLLDLMGPADSDLRRHRRRSIVFRDDRQVQYLYVGYHQAWDLDASEPWSGSTWVTVRPARDVLAAFRDAEQLWLKDHDEDKSSPFWFPELPEDEPDWLLSSSGRGEEASAIETYLNRLRDFLSLQQLQQALLARNDSILTSALLRQLLEPAGYVSAEPDLLECGPVRDLLRDNPLTVRLPPLPRASGDARDFKSRVQASLETYREHWRVLRPLTIPVKATFLVVPPAQGKDLDNIALTVLPIVHEVFKPHIAPHILTPTHPHDPESNAYRQRAISRLRSLNAESVTAYQVIELPRQPADPADGILRLALGTDAGHSWWAHVTDYVSMRFETD